MTENNLRSQSLDLLRFPLAVIIVIVHVFNSENIIVQGKVYDATNFSLYNDCLLFIDAFLRGISVPVYFFISGYVFFIGVGNLTKEKYIRKIRNRIKTLLIPYLIWNLVEIIMGLCKVLLYSGGSFSNYGAELNLTWSNILSCFWAYNGNLFVPVAENGERIIQSPSVFPLNAPLWFLRDLMVVVLFTPLLEWIIKHTKYWLIVILGIVWLMPNMTLPFDNAFFFFSFGAYMSINSKDMLVEFGHYFKDSMIIYPLFSLLSLIAVVYNNSVIAHWLKAVSIIGFLGFSYNVSVWILRNTKIKSSTFYVSASFFIYVTHTLIFARMTKFLFWVGQPDNGIATISAYIMSVVLTILLLLFVFFIMKRWTPSLLRVVTGRK